MRLRFLGIFESKIMVIILILCTFMKSIPLGIVFTVIAIVVWVGGIIINIVNIKRRKAGKPHLFSKKSREKIIGDDTELVQDMKFNKRKVYRENEVIVEEKEE